MKKFDLGSDEGIEARSRAMYGRWADHPLFRYVLRFKLVQELEEQEGLKKLHEFLHPEEDEKKIEAEFGAALAQAIREGDSKVFEDLSRMLKETPYVLKAEEGKHYSKLKNEIDEMAIKMELELGRLPTKKELRERVENNLNDYVDPSQFSKLLQELGWSQLPDHKRGPSTD